MTKKYETIERSIERVDEESEMKQWKEGILFACALLNRLHDQPGMAADTILESGLANADCRKMDNFEKEMLKIINKDHRLNLKL